MPMEINLSLCLPRDTSSVPLVRHLCKYALWEIGVSRETVGDVELALTEACANVVEHASGDDEYTVEIRVGADVCEISVVDTGRGFDFETLDGTGRTLADERGRGIHLMRALVDGVRFTSEPERGTVVHLVKRLAFDVDAPPPFLRRIHGSDEPLPEGVARPQTGRR